MRVFVAGATGVIGRRLVPMLLAKGHQVTAMTKSPRKLEQLRGGGAEPVLLDAFDAQAVRAALLAAHPDAVIHQLTSIPARIDPRRIERDFAENDRLRGEGTRILVDAAQTAGATRIVAQSIAFAYAPGPAGTVRSEADPLFLQAPEPFKRTARAIAELERTVADAGGVSLRYGYFYGPGSSIAAGGAMGDEVRRRRLPIVGGGQGVWSFIQIDDAARATVAALTHGSASTYNIVDDDPAPVSQWLPALAEALGARAPRRVPAWLARPLAGSYGVRIMTQAQGASNELAKRELDWQPQHASWREGFRAALD